MKAVGQDIAHESAAGHVSGTSLFIDDMPMLRDELFVDFLGSPVAHAKILNIDIGEALAVPGIIAVLTHRDVPGHNHFGPIIKDEHLLVEEVATYIGDPIVLLAAENRKALIEAKRKVKLEIEALPPIFTIDEALAAEQFIGTPRKIERGDVDAALCGSKHLLAGSFTVGGQEHFYLESQAAIAVPGEAGTMTIHSSTQHPSETQALAAEVLGVAFSQVTVICKRMGGGFGGKESQAAQPAAMAALVAHRTGRPARFLMDKDDDMRFTGKRHPFKSWYRVGFDDAGRITALVIDYFSNGGCSADLSPSILERAMLHTDNAYFLPDVRITGRVCKTNLPSNTAFRGFGGPQGVANIEHLIEAIADHLGLDSYDVRKVNLYGPAPRDLTPYGQPVKNNVLPQLVEQLAVESDYPARRAEITRLNQASKTHLRGLALVPVKFGISFTKKSLNQANALVNIYTDSTVLLSTGGTEMGQGLYTRMRQIAADALGISYDTVRIADTATDKNNNTSPTAASSGTDLNGSAVLAACEKLRERLTTFANDFVFKQSPGSVVRFEDGTVFPGDDRQRSVTFKQIVQAAYLERVNLGERGFYATPGVDFDRDAGTGTPFLYFTNGAALTEVSVDRFTGELKVERVDLLMDVGLPINPGIDRGQIVGGFVQGMGWVTNEELRYSESGELLSHSPTTYKIPNAGDIPRHFNVRFFDNPDNEVSLHRSKAVGEPPLLLGLSVWAAARNALSQFNAAAAQRLALPATGEALLMALYPPEEPLPTPHLADRAVQTS